MGESVTCVLLISALECVGHGFSQRLLAHFLETFIRAISMSTHWGRFGVNFFDFPSKDGPIMAISWTRFRLAWTWSGHEKVINPALFRLSYDFIDSSFGE